MKPTSLHTCSSGSGDSISMTTSYGALVTTSTVLLAESVSEVWDASDNCRNKTGLATGPFLGSPGANCLGLDDGMATLGSDDGVLLLGSDWTFLISDGALFLGSEGEALLGSDSDGILGSDGAEGISGSPRLCTWDRRSLTLELWLLAL